MSDITFDILEYMSGMTGYVFDKAVLQRIALDRGVFSVTSVDELTQKDKDLLLADMLYTAYLSPSIWASYNQSHGSFKRGVGGQSMYSYDKELVKSYFKSIYKRYNDDKSNLIEDTNSGQMTFISL